jgi:ABC-type nitrate/sulfonate/bicarbonate transport system substrate-binding protein
MKRKSFIAGAVAVFAIAGFLLSAGPALAQEKPIQLRISHQPEFETFPTWLAMQEGLDKKAGMELKLVYFDSGMPQIEALPAKQWEIGATGGVPMMMAALRYGAYMIGMTHDDGYNNMVLVRADSPILKVKGANPKYPEVYGSADLIKGKTVLTTTVSSGHYALSSWLKVFGLKDADVKIQNLEQGRWQPTAPSAAPTFPWSGSWGRNTGTRMRRR